MKLFALLILLAAPASAQAPYDSYMNGVPECLASGDNACIGNGAAACFEGAPDGETTVGMMSCLLAERDAWDTLLNAEYQSARAAAATMDDAERDQSPEFAVRADRLREAQRAWIAFRDTNCAMSYAVYGAGSMRQISGADCQMQMTAERTIQLRSLRQMLTEG
ncbi:lysozyme inhibitor LprI family protein [Pararhodobacter zhoushanensis]|uniref:DUF1311 domain-containing protein n=1 Tax=Pararhodobacter zhoushanensis TaxID=2479545 RepID=A0ABT3H0N7_9RHOB|nr:lysozyme inhibitor LprI family protein [Pararhodobacter zhoushanensis]MCW1933331.1 DUF1311 domain-containing protein [Pararhodobacter zhoushanensis]